MSPSRFHPQTWWRLQDLTRIVRLPARAQDRSKQAVKKDGKEKKKKDKGAKKASFKRHAGKHGLKAGVDKSKKKDLKYGDYCLAKLPQMARPDEAKPNLGKHSYTLTFGGAVEVLLSKEAFYVKKVGPNGTGPKGQISWVKNGGPDAAFELARARAGLERGPNA